jgi:hypothetical protein
VLVAWADFTPTPDTHRTTKIRFRARVRGKASELELALV